MLYNEENRGGQWYDTEHKLNEEESGTWYNPESAPTEPDARPEETVSPADSAATDSASEAKSDSSYFTPTGSNGSPIYPKAPRKKSDNSSGTNVWRIIAIVAIALLLASLLVLVLNSCDVHVNVYRDKNDDWEDASYGQSHTEDGDFDDDYDDYGSMFDLPDEYSYFFSEGSEDDWITDAEENDWDMEEFFDNYYTESSDSRIPAAETGTGVTLNYAKQIGKELTLQEIYEKVNPAVVAVVTYVDGVKYAWGSGVLFDPSGYLLTNEHVIESCDAAEISFPDGSVYEAQVVGWDTGTDIAVLKIESEDGSDFPYADFADSNTCEVGDTVVAIGNPVGPNYAGTMTDGIISSIDRSMTKNGYTTALLQTNAALNEGNSGGPLVNTYGQVVGITNMKIMYSYNATVEGIGFAIPTSVIKPMVDEIIETGVVASQPTIGIVAGSIPEEAKELYNLPDGIYVSEVNENSDAYAQGIQVGDVITAVNNIPVTSVTEVNAIKDGMSVGDTLTCTVYRDGKTFTITFALVEKSLVS